DGSGFSFVGRYRRTQPQVSVRVTGTYGAEAVALSRGVMLPEFDDTHAHLPRVWARARVDAILREMDLNGEREDYINQVIRLSKKYKFVTPYTGFIAAPRALLRPRLIQPGDPVIRVKTDASVKSVFTRTTGSPGCMSRGGSRARGAAMTSVYGVTDLSFIERRMSSLVESSRSPFKSVSRTSASTRARAFSRSPFKSISRTSASTRARAHTRGR